MDTWGGACELTQWRLPICIEQPKVRSEIDLAIPKTLPSGWKKLDLSLQSIPERHLSLHTGSKNAFRSKDPVRNLIFSTRGVEMLTPLNLRLCGKLSLLVHLFYSEYEFERPTRSDFTIGFKIKMSKKLRSRSKVSRSNQNTSTSPTARKSRTSSTPCCLRGRYQFQCGRW